MDLFQTSGRLEPKVASLKFGHPHSPRLLQEKNNFGENEYWLTFSVGSLVYPELRILLILRLKSRSALPFMQLLFSL